jgi:hypothetical protein
MGAFYIEGLLKNHPRIQPFVYALQKREDNEGRKKGLLKREKI